ncbi:hypothetical protein PF008_g22586 [Phytophthora fragariae]|uniref:DUF6818 domain-containing protein n=1 Tax=Phytophthora fragariae TaxID=53985 RepID=A0A6G0QUC2_9STRA|nr:hypothetical protein PF008_g22586 [Phytophthora fragariae]
MWEEVALEYNSRRGRSWLERDYDSLRRKFRNLYGKTKPTGNNDGLPPKLRPIALAHEVQYAIEMKGGAHTSHDGFDRGQDDAHLLRDVAAVLDGAGGDATEEAAGGDDEDPAARDSASDEGREDEEDSQASVIDFRQRGHIGADADPEPTPTSVGTIVTRRGAFDASLGEDVWFDEEDEASPLASTSQVVVGGGGGETSVATSGVGGGGQRTIGDAALERALVATARADSSVYGEGGSPVDDDSASNSQLVAAS